MPLVSQSSSHDFLKVRIAWQDNTVQTHMIDEIAQNVHGSDGDAGCTLSPLFKLQANVGFAKPIPEYLENHRHMVLAGVVRDADIRHDRTVEVSAADVLEIAADILKVEAEKALPRPKIPKLEKEMGPCSQALESAQRLSLARRY